MTLSTGLAPLNSETYNSSFTVLYYVPTSGKSFISMEIVKFNSFVKLSQQYAILGKISKKIGKLYKKSEDKSLMQLAQNYFIMKDDPKFLSKLVKKQLSEYNNNAKTKGFSKKYAKISIAQTKVIT